MGRKRNPHKPAISNKNRVRMCRHRKKLKNAIRQRNQQVILNTGAEIGVTPPENTLNEHIESNLKTKLRDWCNRHRIAKTAINDLLGILISSGIDSIPKNHRTLQKTPTNLEINTVAGGHYWHNGLEKCLMQIFCKLDRDIEISLNFNIDGLPLYKSSTIAFYPILAAIHGMHTQNENNFLASYVYKINHIYLSLTLS